jgi:imidazolonepropionase-like amidohydrolase
MPDTSLDIINCTLLDGTGAVPRPRTSLRITNGRIAAIWQGDVAPPEASAPAVTTVDASGLTVMPGMIDAHVHMTYGEGRTAEELDVYSGPEWSAIRAVWNARKVINAGVTTIIDPGGTYFVGVAVREAIINGMFPGPRICCAGRHISADGGFADYFPSWLGMPSSAEGVLCGTKDEMLREVRRQVKNRVDFIKLSGDSQAQEKNMAAGPCFTEEEFAAMIGMAHQLGRKVATHARHAETIAMAVRNQIDWIYHASHLRRQDVGRVRDSATYLCPTLTFAQNIIDWGADCGSTQAHIDLRKREVEGLVRTYTMAREAGIPIMSGTESGFSMCPYGDWHGRELELLVTLCGLSPMEAIVAATATNARAIGWEQDVGTLEVGRYGDLLLLDGNPLDDIRLLQNPNKIKEVFKGGEIVVRTKVAPRRRTGNESGFAVSTRQLARDPVTLSGFAAVQ